jgi:hypothetical protein
MQNALVLAKCKAGVLQYVCLQVLCTCWTFIVVNMHCNDPAKTREQQVFLPAF